MEELKQFIKENHLNVVEMDGKSYVTDFKDFNVVFEFLDKFIGYVCYLDSAVSIIRNKYREFIKVTKPEESFEEYLICEIESSNGVFGYYLGFDITDII